MFPSPSTGPYLGCQQPVLLVCEPGHKWQSSSIIAGLYFAASLWFWSHWHHYTLLTHLFAVSEWRNKPARRTSTHANIHTHLYIKWRLGVMYFCVHGRRWIKSPKVFFSLGRPAFNATKFERFSTLIEFKRNHSPELPWSRIGINYCEPLLWHKHTDISLSPFLQKLNSEPNGVFEPSTLCTLFDLLVSELCIHYFIT